MIDSVIVIICLLASFIATYFATKIWIFVARNIKLQGKDMNKLSKPLVSESGGIAPVMAIARS
ncbi:MAG: glycosyl transferase family 4, partial [Candidatus Aenigmarchaeota archaeon]|nr:glycosyl transferase family 4 [Candidatus Aenigmarchaeota archaeon]